MKFTKDEFDALEKTHITTVRDTSEKTLQLYRVWGRGNCTANFDTQRNNFGVTLQFQSNHFNWVCESLDQAKLIVGVLKKANHEASPNVHKYDYPAETHMPVGIAVAGRQVIASYMKLFYDEDQHVQQNGGTRSYIAQLLDVKKDTISSYWNRTRWNGCLNCSSEHIEEIEVSNKETEVSNSETTWTIMNCQNCRHYFTNNDERRHIHTNTPPETYPFDGCSNHVTRKTVSNNDDVFYLWTCDECGFTTAEPDRDLNDYSTVKY